MPFLKKLAKLLKPSSYLDVIGIILILWVSLPFMLNPVLLQGLEFSLFNTLFYIPVSLLASFPVPMPNNADLGAILYLILNYLLILLIINLLVLLLTKILFKKFSYKIVLWSGLFILLIFACAQINTFFSRKEQLSHFKELDSQAEKIEVSVNNCKKGESLKNFYTITCMVKFTNLPFSTSSPAHYRLYVGSKEYKYFTDSDLEVELSKSGVDKDYLVNIYNHIYTSMKVENTTISSDAVSGLFTFTVDPQSLSAESFYVTSLEISKDYDIYRKDSLQIPLF